MDNILEPEYF